MQKSLLTLLLTVTALCAIPNVATAKRSVRNRPAVSRVHLVDVAPGYSQTSVNTTIFRNAPLATHGRWQFICYYDSAGYVTLGRRRLGRRRLGRSRWTICRTPYRGQVSDAHNSISMGIDGRGYLHLSFDHHGHPLHYCRGLAPLSLQLDSLRPMTGIDEQDVTYPEFYRLRGGDLLFAYRSGASGRGNLVLNRYDVRASRWERVQPLLLDGENQRNAYWQLCVDPQGVIHLSWVWRETWLVETNHDLCYARSSDNGRTWQHADGTPYVLPIRQSNAEVAWPVPQGSELINQTSMTADAQGHPYIATYWRDSLSAVPQYRLVWHDGRSWHMEQVGTRHMPFTLRGGGTKMIPMSRPRLVADGRRLLYFFRDAERGSRVSVAVNPDLGRAPWQVSDLTPYSVDAWEPSLDLDLWNARRQLHLFVQCTHQGDGERQVQARPEMVRVMEVK